MGDQRAEQRHTAGEDMKRYMQDKSPPSSKTAAVAMLLPLGGILLALSGMTMVATVIGLTVTAPLFLLCSPVLVPAAVVISLAVAGFLASGAFGLTALTALGWIVNYMRNGEGGKVTRDFGKSMQEQMEHVKRRMTEAAGNVGQKTKDLGQAAVGQQNKGN